MPVARSGQHGDGLDLHEQVGFGERGDPDEGGCRPPLTEARRRDARRSAIVAPGYLGVRVVGGDAGRLTNSTGMGPSGVVGAVEAQDRAPWVMMEP